MVPQENKRDSTILSSVKIGSYGVIGVVSAVFMSSVAPPLFTSSSSRAVVNAPITPLTSPIGGTVTGFAGTSAGDASPFSAIIQNDRVDRSTLIGLQMQMGSLQNELDLKKSILADYRDRIADMEGDLERQRQAVLALSENALENANISMRSAKLKAETSKINLNRQLRLIDKGAVAGTQLEIENKLAEEEASTEAAIVNTARLQAILDNLKNRVYVGTENESLSNLEREIRARKADYSQIELQAASLETRKTELASLLGAEDARVARLNKAEIAADPSSVLYRTVAQVGKQVSPGDTVAEAINCQNAFVVAIFSEREAQALSVGSNVNVTIGNDRAPLTGVVTRLVPRTTERVDLDYAVPFPPTERRELYAYISPDEASRQDRSQMAKFCSVGTWVSVSLKRQWVDDAQSALAAGADRVYDGGRYLARELRPLRKDLEKVARDVVDYTATTATAAFTYAQNTVSQGYLAVSSLLAPDDREFEAANRPVRSLEPPRNS